MAIIWRKTIANNHYEVRKSGASLRLYSNGVFHSQFNHRYPLAGSIWDLLVLPALMRPMHSTSRVLVLGVGGGAVIRQLNSLLKPRLIVGIELDPVHIEVARKVFKVGQDNNVALHCVNAVSWLQAYRGPGFDLIIEDLFIEKQGEPHRAIEAARPWVKTLIKHLSIDGALVMNFDSQRSLRSAVAANRSLLKSEFQDLLKLQVPGYDNRVAAFLKEQGGRMQLSDNLTRLKGTYGPSTSRRLRARINKLEV